MRVLIRFRLGFLLGAYRVLIGFSMVVIGFNRVLIGLEGFRDPFSSAESVIVTARDFV